MTARSMDSPDPSGLGWLLLSYRMPREPSTPRIAVWRTLKRLGVVQLGDGLVALPADARTQEQLEWVGEHVDEAGGTSSLWRAQLTSRRQERALVARMAGAREVEYERICAKALAAAERPDAERDRLVRSLRRELREVAQRDYFPPLGRDRARSLVQSLAAGEPDVASVDRRPAGVRS